MEKYRLLFESVFKKKLTEEDAVGNLERIAAEHPYFSVAQFYLLLLSPKDTAAYKLQAKKTAVFFNNNYWLNFQLLQAGNNSNPVFTKEPVSTVTIEQAAEINQWKEKTAEPSNEHIANEFIATEPLIEKEEQQPATVTTEEISEIATETLFFEPAEEPPAIETESISETMETESNETSNEEQPIKVKEEAINIQPAIINEEEETAFAESLETIDDAPEAETEEIAPIAETITAEQVVSVSELTIPEIAPANTNEALVFEPLHTSDYFASVGIKLSEEEKTSDKLGKQLKSFTDWLKTMKKVHAQQSFQANKPAGTEATATDSSIQKLAEKSNQEDEILTEAMAEVLLQQGRQDKAIEILEKLSLLNPSKNAYFAAKINQIKEK
ncbi:MAG: hypothetical protein IPP72_17525 [Chitinophagaceae bacterium]|nr:hypothetical protein [Chitinophagaceae bacterium]